MFSVKHLLGLLFVSLFLASCTPLPPYQASNPSQVPVQGQVADTAVPKTPEQLKKEAQLEKARIKANAEAKARRERLRRQKQAQNAEQEVKDTTTQAIQPIKRDPIPPVKSRYRTASKIPGKPGFVFNPFTNKAVDVRGLPSGQLIRDPNDGNPDHKFRVP